MTVWQWFASVCLASALAASCSDFSGDVRDPGAAGPVVGGPRSIGYGGSNNVINGGAGNNSVGGSGNNGTGGSGGGQASPLIVLASGLNAQTLALDDQFVYATSDQGLVRVPKAGGTLMPIGILQQQGSFSGLAVDNTSVYYVTNSGSIESVPKEGGPIKGVVPSGMGGGAGSLVLDADLFYYIVGPYLRRAPRAGGAFTDLTMMVHQGGNQANRLAVDSTYVYFISSTMQGNTQISAVPKVGGPVQMLASAQGSIGALAAGDLSIAFTDIYAFGGTKLDLQFAAVGQSTRTITSMTFMNSYPDVGGALAIDATPPRAYFAGSPGLLRYDGSTQTLDASVQPRAIVLDTNFVYFADSGGSGGPNGGPGLKKFPK